MTGRTLLILAGTCDVADDGDTWHILAKVDAPAVSPWPNPHESHVGEITVFKANGAWQRTWTQCQFNVWRSAAGVPWRVYAESKDQDPTGPVEFDTGYSGQTAGETYLTQNGATFRTPLAFIAAQGVIED